MSTSFLIAQPAADYSAVLDMCKSALEQLPYEFESNDKKEKMLEEIQAYLIETVFLQPIFEMQDASLFEDEEENQFYKRQSQVENQLIVRALAEKLAEQDILQLKKLYLSRIATTNTKISRSGFQTGK
ncbi:hypothetical protein ACFL96_00905 [Thermoproteota archaeon]